MVVSNLHFTVVSCLCRIKNQNHNASAAQCPQSTCATTSLASSKVHIMPQPQATSTHQTASEVAHEAAATQKTAPMQRSMLEQEGRSHWPDRQQSIFEVGDAASHECQAAYGSCTAGGLQDSPSLQLPSGFRAELTHLHSRSESQALGHFNTTSATCPRRKPAMRACGAASFLEAAQNVIPPPVQVIPPIANLPLQGARHLSTSAVRVQNTLKGGVRGGRDEWGGGSQTLSAREQKHVFSQDHTDSFQVGQLSNPERRSAVDLVDCLNLSSPAHDAVNAQAQAHGAMSHEHSTGRLQAGEGQGGQGGKMPDIASLRSGGCDMITSGAAYQGGSSQASSQSPGDAPWPVGTGKGGCDGQAWPQNGFHHHDVAGPLFDGSQSASQMPRLHGTPAAKERLQESGQLFTSVSASPHGGRQKASLMAIQAASSLGELQQVLHSQPDVLMSSYNLSAFAAALSKLAQQAPLAKDSAASSELKLQLMSALNQAFDEHSRRMYPVAICSFLAAAAQLKWPLSERSVVKCARRVRDFDALSGREVAAFLAGLAGNREHVQLHVVSEALTHVSHRLSALVLQQQRRARLAAKAQNTPPPGNSIAPAASLWADDQQCTACATSANSAADLASSASGADTSRSQQSLGRNTSASPPAEVALQSLTQAAWAIAKLATHFGQQEQARRHISGKGVKHKAHVGRLYKLRSEHKGKKAGVSADYASSSKHHSSEPSCQGRQAPAVDTKVPEEASSQLAAGFQREGGVAEGLAVEGGNGWFPAAQATNVTSNPSQSSGSITHTSRATQQHLSAQHSSLHSTLPGASSSKQHGSVQCVNSTQLPVPQLKRYRPPASATSQEASHPSEWLWASYPEVLGQLPSNQPAPALATALRCAVDEVCRVHAELNAQQVSNTAWACATTGYWTAANFDALAQRAVALMEAAPSWQGLQFGVGVAEDAPEQSQVCPTVVDAAGLDQSRVAPSQLLSEGALAADGLSVKQRFTPQGVSNLLWAFAKMRHRHDALLTSACTYLSSRYALNKQVAANALWALAVLAFPHEGVCAAAGSYLAAAGGALLDRPTELCSALWAACVLHAVAGQGDVAVRLQETAQKVGEMAGKLDLAKLSEGQVSQVYFADLYLGAVRAQVASKQHNGLHQPDQKVLQTALEPVRDSTSAMSSTARAVKPTNAADTRTSDSSFIQRPYQLMQAQTVRKVAGNFTNWRAPDPPSNLQASAHPPPAFNLQFLPEARPSKAQLLEDRAGDFGGNKRREALEAIRQVRPPASSGLVSNAGAISDDSCSDSKKEAGGIKRLQGRSGNEVPPSYQPRKPSHLPFRFKAHKQEGKVVIVQAAKQGEVELATEQLPQHASQHTGSGPAAPGAEAPELAQAESLGCLKSNKSLRVCSAHLEQDRILPNKKADHHANQGSNSQAQLGVAVHTPQLSLTSTRATLPEGSQQPIDKGQSCASHTSDQLSKHDSHAPQPASILSPDQAMFAKQLLIGTLLHQRSSFEADVLHQLQALQLRPVANAPVFGGVLQADMALQIRGRWTAVEVDGPQHFFINRSARTFNLHDGGTVQRQVIHGDSPSSQEATGQQLQQIQQLQATANEGCVTTAEHNDHHYKRAQLLKSNLQQNKSVACKDVMFNSVQKKDGVAAQTGYTRFRNRLLELGGFDVVCVSIFDYDMYQGKDQKRAILLALLGLG